MFFFVQRRNTLWRHSIRIFPTALSLLVEAREKAGLTQAALAERFSQPEEFVCSLRTERKPARPR